jgi:very-short-patch-repair endonuclease
MGKNSIKNAALLQELKAYLSSKFNRVDEEVVFNKIMDTKRLYRADYCIMDEKIIIEINGGQYSGGRHTRAGKVKGKVYTQYENDLNKLNLAQKNGWKVYQFTYEMLSRLDYKDIL